jgi:hypothetical protein
MKVYKGKRVKWGCIVEVDGITGESTDKFTGKVVVALSEIPHPPCPSPPLGSHLNVWLPYLARPRDCLPRG